MRKLLLFTITAFLTVNVWGQTTTNTFPDNGNVGIGTTTPDYQLDVIGRGQFINNGDNIRLKSTNSGVSAVSYLRFFESDNTALGYVGIPASSNNDLYLTSYNDNIRLFAGGTSRLLVHSNGNIGIGTNTPDYSLDIDMGNQIAAYARIKGNSPSIVYTIHRESGTAAAINAMNLSFYNGTITANLINIGMLARNNIGSTPTLDYFFIGKSYSDNALRIYPNKDICLEGKLGVGIENPTTNLDLLGRMLIRESSFGYTNGDVWFYNHSGETYGFLIRPYDSDFNGGSFNYTNDFGYRSDRKAWYFDDELHVYNSILVNTSNNSNGYELAVEGTIGAREVIVTSDTWADFVFEDDYNLMPLQELDSYIQENKHLPEIPTSEEVQENGISVGEMNAKLLQKIEELTLHTIEQQKIIESLLNRVEKLESK